jgi:predicted AlkP superfamily pyrophosphatase or phosphodiesterase
MSRRVAAKKHAIAALFAVLGLLFATTFPLMAHVAPPAVPPKAPSRPKLIVLVVVDQMRADYVDKFREHWTGGFERLIEEGAWFRDAAYPYAATETCVGHATISTGAFPATHGMVANAWWDRDSQKMVTCTADPSVQNVAYGGATVKGGDSAWRMRIPSFAEELKFQTGDTTRVVTLSLKARASITMAGHKADAVVWFDPAAGAWTTSSVYPIAAFVEEYAKSHPIKNDYGKTWALSLAPKDYLYGEKATGAVAPEGWDLSFPHPLRGKAAGSEPDAAFYEQWQSSPYADSYLTRLAETAVDQLTLGKGPGTDFLAVGYSTVDYVGHEFGPRSREIEDVLLRLDKDLADLFAHLDQKVGRGNYVVALTADHGVVPVPEDMQKTGADAGVLHLPEVEDRIERALEPFSYPKPAVVRIAGSDVYFAPGIYEKLKDDSKAMSAVLDAIRTVPGVEGVYRAEEVADRPATQNPLRRAMSASYFPGRSGDLLIVPKAYWLMDSTPLGKARRYGTGHGVPWDYDQRVPVFLMGFGIQPGEYFGSVTPADIAPTFASLCGITLAPRDGRILSEAFAKPARAETRPRVSVPPAQPKKH